MIPVMWPLQDAHRRIEAAVVARRDPERQRREGGHALLEDRQRGLHGRGHLRRVGPEVHSEEHVANDDERQLRHLVVERQLAARRGDLLPAGKHLAGAARDDGREVDGVLTLEGGLHPPPLLPPGIAIGGEQALAPVRLDAIEDPSLPVVLMVVLKDMLHVPWDG